MKYLLNTVSALSFLALIIFASCGGDDPVDEQTPGEIQALLLEQNGQPWSIAAISFDGISRIETWGRDFQVTFTGSSEDADGVWGGNFRAEGFSSDEPDAQSVWPSSGTWDFTGSTSADVNSFVRNDGVTVTVVQVTSSTLILTFTVPDPAGRADAVFDAEWRMEFTSGG